MKVDGGSTEIQAFTDNIKLTANTEINGTLTASNVTFDNESRLAAAELTLNGKADIVHTHNISDVTDLQTTLNNKTDIGHTHTIFALNGLEEVLNTKANAVHTHAISDVTNLQEVLDGKADTVHTHFIRDINGLQTVLNAKANMAHTHTISNGTNLQTTLDGKADISHSHSISDVTNLQTTLDGKSNTNHTHTSFADITMNTINGCSINATNGDVIVQLAIPVVKTDGIMEIGKILDFHTTYDGTQDYNVRVDCSTAKFTLNVPISISTTPTSTVTVPFQYTASTDFGTDKGCRMSIGDPTHSAYYGCWKNNDDSYCAYMKVDGSNSAEIQALRITSNLQQTLKLTERLLFKIMDQQSQWDVKTHFAVMYD